MKLDIGSKIKMMALNENAGYGTVTARKELDINGFLARYKGMPFVLVDYFDEKEIMPMQVWLAEEIASALIAERFFERVYPNGTEVLPERKTASSAGYDFVAPCDIKIPAKGFSKLVLTGIRAYMPKNEYLALHIRSSLAVKHGLTLINAVGIIDADYYDNEDNGGNIGVKFYNSSDTDYVIKAGERMMQGIFAPYRTVDNDKACATRTGGIGSTGE